MAHFAQIDENNVVVQVLVTDNNDSNGDEGHKWLVDNLGGTWIKTSFNTYGNQHIHGGEPLRGNFAGIGYTYDSVNDVFIPPKMYDSWILNENTWLWEAPIPYPNDGQGYVWNEKTQTWVP